MSCQLILFTLSRVVMVVIWGFYFLGKTIFRFLAPRALLRGSIKGQIVLITGGASGIGRKVAQRLSEKGAHIVSWDINEEGNQETAKLIRDKGGKCSIYRVDVSLSDAVYEAEERVKADVGKVDILINNVGVLGDLNFISETSDSSIKKVFQVNILSMFWMVKAFLPDMIRAEKGHIVTIASLTGIQGSHISLEYTSSAFAAVGFDESLRLQLDMSGHYNIATTIICPSFIDTPLTERQELKFLPKMKSDTVAEEIVDAILMKTRIQVLPHSAKILSGLKAYLPERTIRQGYHYFVEVHKKWTPDETNANAMKV